MLPSYIVLQPAVSVLLQNLKLTPTSSNCSYSSKYGKHVLMPHRRGSSWMLTSWPRRWTCLGTCSECAQLWVAVGAATAYGSSATSSSPVLFLVRPLLVVPLCC